MQGRVTPTGGRPWPTQSKSTLTQCTFWNGQGGRTWDERLHWEPRFELIS